MTISFETINNINDLKKGDIVFFEGKGLISWWIRYSQRKDAKNKNILDDNNPEHLEHLKYTHVAIYIGNGVMYHADIRSLKNMFFGGVSFGALDICCKESKSCLILRNDYIDKSVEHFGLFGLINEFKDIRGTYNKGYGVLEIIKFWHKIEAHKFIPDVFKKKSTENNKVLDKKRYYCSQLILNILINYDILEHSESNITPFELMHILFKQDKVNAKFIYTLSKEAETKEYQDFVEKAKLYAEKVAIVYNAFYDKVMNDKKLNKIIEEINKQFDEIILFDGNNADTYNNWGVYLYILGEHKDAIMKYEKAIECNPKFAEAYNNWGSALGYIGEYNEAIKKYEKAIKLNPNYADAYYNWGVALDKLEKYEEAIMKYEKALSLVKKKNFDEDKIQGIERYIEIAKQELTKMLIIN